MAEGRILVVDDSPLATKIMSTLFAREETKAAGSKFRIRYRLFGACPDVSPTKNNSRVAETYRGNLPKTDRPGTGTSTGSLKVSPPSPLVNITIPLPAPEWQPNR